MGDASGSSTVLVVNSGSSSLKLAVFSLETGAPRRLAVAAVEGIGSETGHARVNRGSGPVERSARCAHHPAALTLGLELLDSDVAHIDAVGHRIVHGGPSHVQPAILDPALRASLAKVVALAPLHLPACLAGVDASAARFPDAVQIACFDTAFHASLPELAARLPLPARFAEVRRYGFHGLSYEHVLATLGPAAPRRIVIAHLGGGSSLVAVKDGRSIDTTMSFTPAGGVLMGTRAGDLDPGALIYLARERGQDVAALERIVNQESGLLALGGHSDLKTLVELSPSDPQARLAVEMFGYAVRKQIGAYTAALGGLDLLVFTGGIGEHSARVRALACRELEVLGVTLDEARNARGDAVISAASSRCEVRLVTANEELVIARHVATLLGA
jgi:acetate kinase